jgi:hypothetical protein
MADAVTMPLPYRAWWAAKTDAERQELRRAPHDERCPASGVYPRILWLCTCGATAPESAA